MEILKRNKSKEPYERKKISRVIQKAFESVGTSLDEAILKNMVDDIEENLFHEVNLGHEATVEDIQDLVEMTLVKNNYYKEVKSFILYRDERKKKRRIRSRLAAYFPEMTGLEDLLKDIQTDYPEEEYALSALDVKFRSFYKEHMSLSERQQFLLKASVELTTKDAPKWEFIASRLYFMQYQSHLTLAMKELGVDGFYEKLEYLTEIGLYGDYILKSYTRQEIEEAYTFIDESRNSLLTYSALELLLMRYVIRTHANISIESIQEMYLGIALHLAMLEAKEDRLSWVKRFYDMISTLKVTMATPTLANARKPYHQLSSCFIDTVPDSLDGIYRSIDNFAKVSKFGGGMGLYFGKVRAKGSTIRGFEGAAGGVIRWIRLANDTAVAVDQLGVRQGAVAVYLDAWHKDLPEFLNLRTNNGDDRLKAHDVFPAVCFPDYFWAQVRDNLNGNWHLMCPHEIKTIKGYSLEDSFGEEWTKRYLDCESDNRI